MSSNKYVTIWIVVFLAIISLLATDFYTPAMPQMVVDLMTQGSMIKLTVTVYILGMAISPLVFGPLSDHVGRRPVLLASAVLGLLGSVFCWLAPNVNLLIIGRLIQGLGLGAGLSLARTIGNDLFEKQEFAQIAGIISLVVAVGPAVAPVIGGYLFVHFGWSSIFFLVTLMIATGGFAVFSYVPETIITRETGAFRLRELFANFRSLVIHRVFISYTVLAGLSISIIILFGVLSTFILQKQYHLTPVEYGWIMMLVTGMSFISRISNIILLRKFTPEYCIVVGLVFMMVGSVMALVGSVLKLHYLLCIVIPSMVIVFGAGTIPSNTVALALGPFRQQGGGSAGAIYGSITMLSVFAVSIIGTFLPASNLILALIYLGLSVSSVIVMLTQTSLKQESSSVLSAE